MHDPRILQKLNAAKDRKAERLRAGADPAVAGWQCLLEEMLVKLEGYLVPGRVVTFQSVAPEERTLFEELSRSLDLPPAERIVIVSEGQVIGDHQRHFGRGKTIFDPWHYLPALERKPGALRNGAPFKHWDLPKALGRIGEQLQSRYTDWDRQYVGYPAGRAALRAGCGGGRLPQGP